MVKELILEWQSLTKKREATQAQISILEKEIESIRVSIKTLEKKIAELVGDKIVLVELEGPYAVQCEGSSFGVIRLTPEEELNLEEVK